MPEPLCGALPGGADIRIFERSAGGLLGAAKARGYLHAESCSMIPDDL
jgi:hypothetical protein